MRRMANRPPHPPADPLENLLGERDMPPAGATPFSVGEDMVLDGKYRLDRELGRGAMGVLYRALDLRKGEQVAVKVLHWWEENPVALRRFRREAEIASRLDHPNVVTLRDFGRTSENIYYTVMELLEGEDLATRLRGDKRFDDLAVVNSIVQQCASALQAVHDAGVVHRDLKPSNVYLNEEGGPPKVKLIDFGISKLLDAESSLTGRGTVLGGMGYMSPEQALGRAASVDHRADVYALAAITYRMLTGSPPFVETTLTDMVDAIARAAPRPPSELRQLPEAVDRVVLKSLGKTPDTRHATVKSFAEELETALAAAS